MINDWKDAERDNENKSGIRPFTGGSRMIQLGLVSRADMGFFGIILSTSAVLIGIYLVFAFLLNSLTLVHPILYLVASLILVFWVWNYIERHRKVMNDFRLAFKK
ncbi:UbiA prenyltransferase family protein [Paenibacillus macquariensis]|uniref:Uncharacterized protein n=1 Tax=Paenibacillus macquariensis TaxID=948756 RepID=A0ABY1JN09_9BACL|nr:hypothetical protein [Paenibacillus macquariensis]MEC0092251.1 hypothetical protein [Paenibacillus macquariensis]OAB37203.1 hypothetical protein PMSM_03750 [Paenibacillus macquariensis subsp. macquariensis]SIQ47838.1 hypothetical protein SAMN05421578_102173 [Paenibacillus macquariensis]